MVAAEDQGRAAAVEGEVGETGEDDAVAVKAAVGAWRQLHARGADALGLGESGVDGVGVIGGGFGETEVGGANGGGL